MSSEKKRSTQNILTAAVAGVALLLALVVVLLKFNVFGDDDKETKANTVIESSVVVASETLENGDIVYYTMLDYYVKPGYSSYYRYPTTKPLPTESEIQFVEESEVVAVTDAEGNPVLNEDGTPVTEVHIYTVPVTESTTGESTTQFVPRTQGVVVTDRFHRQLRDENGNPLTEVVTLDAYPTEKPDYWSENSQSATVSDEEKKKRDISKDESLASSIVGQINEDRTAQGLEPLSTSSDLKALASAKSMSMAIPELYGKVALPSASYTFTTSYGGRSLYGDVSSSAGSSAFSESTKSVGVAVIKYKDTYYTTVLFR